MSTTLYWRPAPAPDPRNSMSAAFKLAIAQRFWEHDGSLGGEPVIVGYSELDYFRGLRDGGDKQIANEARDMIANITEYGSVELRIEG